MVESQRKNLRRDFSFAENKKILLYGTGIVAHRLLQALNDLQIVGCLDRSKVDGDIDGIPIMTWDDVEEKTADILIVAAARANGREIYDRIIHRCNSLGLDIYGPNGENLRERYCFELTSVEAARYYQKSKEDLKNKIENYDAVSFDLFDTLIMRKTLEPIDIFDLLEERLKDKGMHFPNFKKQRRAAEQKTPGGNIYQIYETLGAMLALDQDTCEALLKEEIRCEKDCIIPRTVMVDLFRYAIALGKRVSILTDMYLPAPILEDILSAIGINGYEKLYVSCDYGVGKSTGLFSIYLETVPDLRCLHIGDNKQSDIEAAQQCGIDAYYIKSAYEMLKISNFRKCLLYETRKCDRAWIGLLISELFNDPFALYQSSGVVRISDVELAGKVFIAPTVVVYLQKLYDVLKSGEYDGVLFAARDGYFFKKIYDSGIIGEPTIPSIYFLTSRKLIFKSTLRNKDDIDDLLHYSLDVSVGEKTLLDLFGQECRPFPEKTWDMDLIFSKSAGVRKNYITYMKMAGVDLARRYLICDLHGRGTVQIGLNKIMESTQDGFYFYHTDTGRDLRSESLYSKQDWNNMSGDSNLLEMILTAPTPSLCDMGKGGNPIYAVEDRAPEVLRAIERAQEGMEYIIKQYFSLYKPSEHMDKYLARTLFSLHEYSIYEGDAAIMYKLVLIDDLITRKHNVRMGTAQSQE